MAAFCTAVQVREYLQVQSTTGQYSDALLNSYIQVASEYIQRATGRQFELQAAVTKVIQTDNSPYVLIPDAATITSVTGYDNAVLVLDEDYEKVVTSGSAMTIALRFGGDSQWWRARTITVVGTFGYATLPAELVLATKVLAGWYAKRPDAVFGSTIQTDTGTIIDVSRLPYEVWQFIKAWNISPALVA